MSLNPLITRSSLFFLCLSPCSLSPPWGFYAHKTINELAIYTLPKEMYGFYKANLDFIREHAVDPDKRRYSVVGEAEKHFIDIDHYCGDDPSCDPFELVPFSWQDAVDSISIDTMKRYGISPWNINLMFYRLTDAFTEKDYDKILQLSTELGHYVGDAHVPLHTTENYNGQLTGQHGIHGFWESRLPELFDSEYYLFGGKASYIEHPLHLAWSTIRESHAALDSVLDFERQLNATWPEDRKYIYEERGRALVRTYSREYAEAFHEMLNGQVERRMRQSVAAVGSLWYTAWVNAGQPELKVHTHGRQRHRKPHSSKSPLVNSRHHE